jgi:hypothetical protein
MKKRFVSIVMGAVIVALSLCILTAAPLKAAPPTMADERADHPRIVAAIHSLEDAIAYMKAAPHNFGGHKAEAIEECQKAIKQLNQALKYREVKDTQKMKGK